jgi:HlyD family secretion protein
LAPLDSAVPAQGFIVAESHRKTVSILDGGTLKTMLVKEGDKVTAGQVLLRLDETQANAQVGQLDAQRWAAEARVARLRAEQAGEHAMAVSPELAAAAERDPSVARFVVNERNLFAARWDAYDSQVASQRAKVAQLTQQIIGLKAQQVSATKRLQYTQEELKGVAELLSRGYERKPRLLELQSTVAEITGNFGEITSHEAEARHAIAGAESDMQAVTTARLSDIAKDVQDTQAQLADVSERLRGARDILDHKDVLAPEAGTVTDIKFFTQGSSINPGLPVLDIVPAGDELVIEAQVAPNDIEHVTVGQKVNVRLLAFKQHKIPVMSGHVTYVSADKIVDAKGDSYFIARAQLEPGELKQFKGVTLSAGMPAEVLILGGERLAVDYFLQPITDAFHRAFREQ